MAGTFDESIGRWDYSIANPFIGGHWLVEAASKVASRMK